MPSESAPPPPEPPPLPEDPPPPESAPPPPLPPTVEETAAAADAAGIPVDEPVGAAERARVRWTAMFGTLGCVLLVVAWFLPWIHVPPEARARIRAAASRDLPDLERRDPEAAEKERVVVRALTEEGELTGLDVFHFLRTSWAVNRLYVGQDPLEGETGRSFMIQRAFLVGAIVFAVLPILALLLALHFVAHRFRRAKSPVLVALALVGCGAAALTITWMRFAEVWGLALPTGIGMRLAGGAAVMQALAGVFGVTGRNWWRVYAGLLAVLGAFTVLVYAYVWGGELP